MPTQAMFNGLFDCVFYGRILSNVSFFSQCASFIEVALSQTLVKSRDSGKAIDGVAEKSNPPENNTHLVS